MKTFQDLIKSGITPSRYDTPLCGQVSTADPFVRTYNNIWGIISDTHMSLLDDGRYVITGTMVADQRKFSSFLYSSNWGGYDFGSTSLTSLNDRYITLSTLINRNECVGSFEVLNGDKVYILTPISKEQNACSVGGPIPCADCCCGVKESSVPIKIDQITKNEKELVSILEGNDSLLDKVKHLNESENIDGSNWSVNYDVDGLRFINENKKYILKR